MKFSILVIFLLVGCGGQSSSTPENEASQAPAISRPAAVWPGLSDADPELLAPGDLNATDAAAADFVHLSWSPVAGAVGYEVYARPHSDADYLLLGETLRAGFEDSEADLQRARQYAVRSIGPDGQSSPLSEFDSGHLAQSSRCAATMYDEHDLQVLAQFKYGFRTPRAVAFDAAGFLYVGSAGSRVYKLNHSRHVVAKWEGLNNIKSMASGAGGVAVLSGRQLIGLKDDCTHVVIADGLSNHTTDLAADNKGRYYVGEMMLSENQSRILGFASDGRTIGRWVLPAGSRIRAPQSIAIDLSDRERLYIADTRNFEIVELEIKGDRIEIIGTRKFPLIGTATDLIVDEGKLFLATKSGKGVTYLTHFHSGLQGGVKMHRVSGDFKSQITQIDINRSSKHVYMADNRAGLIYACEAPLYTCSYSIPGGVPAKIAQDESGNFYVLHTKPAYISKLNRNGSHLTDWYPADDLGQVLDMEVKGDRLHISATDYYDQAAFILEVDTGFGEWRTRDVAINGFFDGFHLALGGEHIFYSDLGTDADGLLTASINGIRYLDSEIDLQAALEVSGEIFTLDAIELGADQRIYYLLTIIAPDGEFLTVLAKYDLLTGQWLRADTYDGFGTIPIIQADNGDYLFYLFKEAGATFYKIVRSDPATGDVTEMELPYNFNRKSMVPDKNGKSVYFYHNRDHSLYKVLLPVP